MCTTCVSTRSSSASVSSSLQFIQCVEKPEHSHFNVLNSHKNSDSHEGLVLERHF